jgi:hypothetical protein
MNTSRRLQKGEWTDGAIRFSVSEPFQSTFEGPPWVAGVLSRSNGHRTVAELRPEAVGRAEFEQTIRELISLGFLELRDEKTGS